MKSIVYSVLVALTFGFINPALADGYVLFPNSGLYCVISGTNYSLTTVQNNGQKVSRTIKQFKHKINSSKRKVVKAKEDLQSRLKNASGSRKAKIKAQISSANEVIKILNQSVAFAKSCGDGALNSFAVDAPVPSRPIGGGGGGKK